MMREDERDRVSRQGTEAWKRLKRDKNWNDWLKVGEALQIGREWALNQSGANQPMGKARPTGRAYNMAFGEWMQRYKLDDMDKGDRSRLFEVMDNLPQIEAWRQTLTLTERLRLNHPNAVLRKWKAAFEPEKPKGEAKPTLRDSVVTLEEENAAQAQRIAELEAQLQEAEAARDHDKPARPQIVEGSELALCSFCDKEKTQVAVLIQSGAAYICNECVEQCVEHIAYIAKRKQETPDRTDETDPVEAGHQPEPTDEVEAGPVFDTTLHWTEFEGGDYRGYEGSFTGTDCRYTVVSFKDENDRIEGYTVHTVNDNINDNIDVGTAKTAKAAMKLAQKHADPPPGGEKPLLEAPRGAGSGADGA